MISGFVGRARELAVLRRRLGRVVESRSGSAVAIRGRRQVGKSRLVQEFCDQAGVPYLFFTATKGASPVEAVRDFLGTLRESSLPRDRELVPTEGVGGWTDALRVLAATLPDAASVVVLDELPWLAEQDESFDGVLQNVWDRLLSPRLVLLILLGSDLHMMERLTAYDRPFYGRADNLVLGPLNPAELGDALGLSGSDAIDAHLVSGGLPGIARIWPDGMSASAFLARECEDPASPVFSVPESSLLAEFPAPDQARRVLEAVGGGDRTFAAIAATAGAHQPLPSGSLSPLLRRLVEEKRILAVDEPLSTRPGKPALYRVADSNVRWYLACLREAHELVRRGRSRTAFELVQRRWGSWRGRAVEPLIRESVGLAAGDGRLPWETVAVVGGWWNRQFDPEVDLVGADRAPVAQRVLFVGSVKWLDSPADRHDVAELVHAARQVPGAEGGTGLMVVSRSGVADDVDSDVLGLTWRPDDVVDAWRT